MKIYIAQNTHEIHMRNTYIHVFSHKASFETECEYSLHYQMKLYFKSTLITILQSDPPNLFKLFNK